MSFYSDRPLESCVLFTSMMPDLMNCSADPWLVHKTKTSTIGTGILKQQSRKQFDYATSTSRIALQVAG